MVQVDPQILPNLFTKLVSKSKNGTGLGLFICKNLIESFGGQIWVQNQDLVKQKSDISKVSINSVNTNNEGTTIAFSIPLVNIKEHTINRKAKISDNIKRPTFHRNEARKILILDDEIDLTVTYRIGLESIGLKVNTYNDPFEALSSFIPHYYDLLLLDIRMPKMNGLEFYKHIKEIDPNVKVYFITAFDSDNELLEQINLLCSEKNYDHIIKKPIEINKLGKMINKKIESR